MPVFLLTDIENSTILWEKYGPEMDKALVRHDAILREQIGRYGGRVIKHTGDGIFAVFEAGDPLQCALAVQQQLAQEQWEAIGELRIRMALHAGDAQKRGDDYFGPAVNRTARVMATGWGGQILITDTVLQTCALPAGASLKDLGVHLLKDLSEPQRIYQLTHPALALQEFPALRSLSAHPHNLPPQPTPFLGRREELTEITGRLHDPTCRLLTLIGPGGIGKTRLSLQAAAEQIEAFPHGVYFVPLAPVNTPGLLVPTIADALKFTFYSREDQKVQLLNYLREKKLLLILDNFEHLIAGAELVADILTNAPQVKVLVTSRERLNLQGETLLELRGMEVPDEAAGEIEGYSSVQLFLQGARRVLPSFSLSEEDKTCVARVCQLVEGMPLGILLAATWVRLLSCPEIVQEIEQSLDFLTTTLRDLPERHRSLRAVFDYSWNLLSEQERVALSRLSVFRGGFQRDAASQVAGVSLPILTSLVDKSLVLRVMTGRYDLHEVVHQYAEEKLRESPAEEARTHDRHWDYYAAFLQRREDDLRGRRQQEAQTEIRTEIENVRAGWRWAIMQGKIAGIDAALDSLFLFYDFQQWVPEGIEAFDRAVRAIKGQPATEATDRTIGRLLARQGALSYLFGPHDQARTLLHQALSIADRLGLSEERAFCFNHLGNIALTSGDYAEAERLLSASLTIYQATDNRRGVAVALNNLGNIAHAQGDYARARHLFQESLSMSQEIGDQRRIAIGFNNLGSVAHLLGEYAEAKRLHQESLAIKRALGGQWGISASLANLGVVAYLLGEYEEARTLHQESLVLCREIGDRRGMARSLNNLADAACALGEYQEAEAGFREALTTAMAIRAMPIVLHGLVGFATLLVKQAETTSGQDALKERAAELLALVSHHPASLKETKDRANHLLTQLAVQLPPSLLAAAQERGQAKTLEAAVTEILNTH